MDKPKLTKKRCTPAQAKAKAEHYCAYQERSQQELRDKLYSWGLHQADVERIISDLIEDNFLSESRFAHAYVSGKFKMKAWGKFKIKAGLKAKQVPTRIIQEALDAIPEDIYQETLEEVLQKKANLIWESDTFVRQQKLLQYALMRGFEREIILEILSSRVL